MGQSQAASDEAVATRLPAQESRGHVNASIAGLEALQPPTGSRTGDAGAQAWAAISNAREAERPLAEGEHWITLETSADSWVEITQADGEMLEEDLVRGGDSRRYRGMAPFVVSLGRSSAVQLTLDGYPVDLTPHTRDDVTRMLLNPADVLPAPEEGDGPPAETPDADAERTD